LIWALMFILCISVNAKAGYIPGENMYIDSNSDGAEAVIIYKGTDASNLKSEDIYYINQCDEAEGFSDLKMGMKLDAPAGEYTVVTTNGKTTFTINNAQAFVSGATKVEFLGAQKTGDASYSAAFGLRAADLFKDISTLTMVIGEKAYVTDLFGDNSIIKWGSGYTEGEKLMLALQIDGIGADYIDDKEGTFVPNFDLYVK